jgi:hypothetical protein
MGTRNGERMDQLVSRGPALGVGAQPAASSKQSQKPRLQRHQWFDAWKTAKGGGLRSLVEATVNFLQHHEDYTDARTRARKPVDEANHLKRVEAVVCNLAHAVLMPPPTGRIAIQLGNRRKGGSRYDSPVYGKGLSPLIWVLGGLDFLDLDRSTIRGEVPSIAPSAWFASKIPEYGVKLADFGRDEAEEVVLSLATHARRHPGRRQAKGSSTGSPSTTPTRRRRGRIGTLYAALTPFSPRPTSTSSMTAWSPVSTPSTALSGAASRSSQGRT